MDGLQVSIACLLVKMTFVQGAAGSCPSCEAGFFLVKNCSKNVGIRCKDCTDCSALLLETLSECTPWTDAVCGNQTVTTRTVTTVTVSTVTATTAGTPVFPDEVWIILSVISVSVFLVLVLALVLSMLSQRYKQKKALYLP